jgi:hypothetical protein
MTDNKYKTGKIYTIRSKNDDNLIHVGSTIQPLHKPFYEHKQVAYNEKHKSYNMLLYQKMRQTYIEDWYIELYALSLSLFLSLSLCISLSLTVNKTLAKTLK